MRVPHGLRAPEHPAIGAAVVAQAIFDLVSLTRVERMLPACQGAFLIVGMEHAVPALSIGRSRLHAGEFIPLVVIIIVEAIGQGGPHHLRHGVGEHLIFRLGCGQRPFGPHLCADLRIGAEPPHDDAVRIADRDHARQEGAVIAVRAAQGEHHLERLPVPDRAGPARDHIGQHVGIVDRLPAPAFHRFRLGPGIIVPALVVPEDRSVAQRDPAERGQKLRQPCQLRGLILRFLRIDAACDGDGVAPIGLRMVRCLAVGHQQGPSV